SFNNNGTVNVITGTMSFDGGASSTEIRTHNFVVSQLATLRFNGGAHSLSPASSVTGGGNVEFMAGTTNIAGTYAIGGSTKVTGGTVVFNSDATSNNGVITAGP